jgi:hypothetical protein
MRISVDKDDRGYHPAPLQHFNIVIDGVNLRDASSGMYIVTVDDGAGEVIEHRKDEHGRFIMCPDAPGRLQRFTRPATVQIRRLVAGRG